MNLLDQRGPTSTTTMVESTTSNKIQAKASPPNEDTIPSTDELNDIIQNFHRNLEELEKK